MHLKHIQFTACDMHDHILKAIYMKIVDRDIYNIDLAFINYNQLQIHKKEDYVWEMGL